MTDIQIIDRALLIDTDIKILTKEYSVLRDQIIAMGLGEHDGSVGQFVVRQNSDSEVFDAKAAFEYVSEHLSPQMLSAVKRKFTKTKAGVVVATPKPRPVKVIA